MKSHGSLHSDYEAAIDVIEENFKLLSSCQAQRSLFDSRQVEIAFRKYPDLVYAYKHFTGHRSALITVLQYNPSLELVKTVYELGKLSSHVFGPGQWQPLHYACAHHASTQVIKFLINTFPESVQGRTDDGLMPLHIGCQRKLPLEQMETVLLAYPNALVESRDKGGYGFYESAGSFNCVVRPIESAIMDNASPEVLELLLFHYPDIHLKLALPGYTGVRVGQIHSYLLGGEYNFVKSFDCSKLPLSSTGANALLMALAKNKSFEELTWNFASNQVDDLTPQALQYFLTRNNTLERLHLHQDWDIFETQLFLANATPELDDDHAGQILGSALVKGLERNKSLKTLTLGLKGINETDIVKLFSRNKSIERFMFTEYPDVDLASLLPSTLSIRNNVRELSLSKCAMRPDGLRTLLASIKRTPNIRALHFVGVKCDDLVHEDLQDIQELKQLRSLTLDISSKIDVYVSWAAQLLKRSKHLEKLSLPGWGWTVNHVNVIADALRANSSVQSLGLDQCSASLCRGLVTAIKEDNCTLLETVVTLDDHMIGCELDHLGLVNRAGRGEARSAETTPERFIAILEPMTWSIPVCYDLLRNNPPLWSNNSSTDASENK